MDGVRRVGSGIILGNKRKNNEIHIQKPETIFVCCHVQDAGIRMEKFQEKSAISTSKDFGIMAKIGYIFPRLPCKNFRFFLGAKLIAARITPIIFSILLTIEVSPVEGIGKGLW